MQRNAIEDEYFDWLCLTVCQNRYSSKISYRRLFNILHDIEFRWSIDMDENRAYDGVDLRYRFTLDNDYDEDLSDRIHGPCSVLEMMVALSIRCEENIMDDTHYGDRTGQWFWGMINSLGLGGMTDDRFDRMFVEDVIDKFLDHDYAPNGTGGLFRMKNCNADLRDMEIWHQLCLYLDNFV